MLKRAQAYSTAFLNQDSARTQRSVMHQIKGESSVDVHAINRHVAFTIALNHAQTATKRSFPAIMIKDLANCFWFEEGKPFRAEAAHDCLKLKSRLVDRLLHKFTELGSYDLDGLDYWPSERVKKKLRKLLTDVGIESKCHDSKSDFTVSEPVFSRIHYNTSSLGSYYSQLSGRYLCVEQVLWGRQLIDPGQSTTASEISKVSRVPKSTLTTMLDQVRGLGIIEELPDSLDARITRWRINMDNPLNIEKDRVLRNSFRSEPSLPLVRGSTRTLDH